MPQITFLINFIFLNLFNAFMVYGICHIFFYNNKIDITKPI